MTQVALYPAIHAEVDERGEGPNLFFIAAEVAQRSGQHSCAGVYRKREPFTVKECRNRHDGAAQSSGDAAAQNADENCGFKAEIGALEVFYAKAEIHAQREGNAGKENKEDVAFAGASAGKEQLLKLMGAAQRAGNSRGYAQFEQKLYEQILKVHKLFLHRTGALERVFAGAALLRCVTETSGREGADILRRGLALNQLGHDFCGDRG